MRKRLFTLLLFVFGSLALSQTALGQATVGYHQSGLPFMSIGYTFSERFTPELRIGTDRYFEDVALEAVLNYGYLRREEYLLYAGLGIFIGEWGGAAVVPIGIQLFPFENKRFGFTLEATPIVGEGSGFLRGSIGIRYRFLKE